MIADHKPAGYVATQNERGQEVVQELRQCCLCQATWIYRPGSGEKRGFCLHHMGLLCGQKACMEACRNGSHVPFFDARMADDNRYQFDAVAGIYVDHETAARP